MSRRLGNIWTGRYTDSQVDRYIGRWIDKEIYGFVSIGTPCLVHDATVLGSHLPTRDSGCKARWMIADGMYRDQVIFYDPRTKDTSRSKSYAAFKLRLGMNFAQALNIDLPNATKKSIPSTGNDSDQTKHWKGTARRSHN